MSFPLPSTIFEKSLSLHVRVLRLGRAQGYAVRLISAYYDDADEGTIVFALLGKRREHVAITQRQLTNVFGVEPIEPQSFA